MFWFWLNIPLATVFFLAWVLIPLWLVLRYPESGPGALVWDQRPAGTVREARLLRAGDDATARVR